MAGLVFRVEKVSLPLADDEVSEIIDVRSPSEFAEDHLPGAINLPVLSDEERARVGTIYCQESPFTARKLGAGLVSANIARHFDGHFVSKPKDYAPLLYCWRGGQRSRGLAIVLAEIGWRVRVLDGGYKAYRAHVMKELERLSTQFTFRVINGLTGAGKTLLLQALAKQGAQTLDLEGLAKHRGSLFGGLFTAPQPTQRLFESGLYYSLRGYDPNQVVFVEAESPRIGQLYIPSPLWRRMQASEVWELDTTLEERARYLVRTYSDWRERPEEIARVVQRLRSMHSKELIASWNDMHSRGEWENLTRSLLHEHYDKRYGRNGSGHYAMPARKFALTDHGESAILDVAKEMLAAAAS